MTFTLNVLYSVEDICPHIKIIASKLTEMTIVKSIFHHLFLAYTV